MGLEIWSLSQQLKISSFSQSSTCNFKFFVTKLFFFLGEVSKHKYKTLQNSRINI